MPRRMCLLGLTYGKFIRSCTCSSNYDFRPKKRESSRRFFSPRVRVHRGDTLCAQPPHSPPRVTQARPSAVDLPPLGEWCDPPRAFRDPDRSSRPVLGASARPSACVSQCGECRCCRRKQKFTRVTHCGGARGGAYPSTTPHCDPSPLSEGVFIGVWLWRDRPGGGDATCSISSVQFTVQGPVSQRHRRAITMRDPGDAATLSNVTPWSLGPSDSEFRLVERRHPRLGELWCHPVALANLEQF